MQKDIATKRLEEHNDVFADIFNNLIFSGQKVLEEGALVSLPTESFSRMDGGRLRQGNRDVCKADKEQNVYRLICGIENQECKDNTMPERIMGYDFAAYEKQIQDKITWNKEHGHPAYAKRLHDGERLAPVITVVLYFGREEWKHPLCLHDILDFPKGKEDILRAVVPDYRINVVQMRRLSVEERECLTSDFRMIAEYLAATEQPEQLEELLKNKEYKIKHPEAFLDLFSEISGDSRYKQLGAALEERQIFEEKGEMTMCVLADMLENRGIEKGIEKGIYALIQDNLEQNNSHREIIMKLQKYFNLTRERAEEYIATQV